MYDILVDVPLSCYTNSPHPHGIASPLLTVRNHLTHSSSSTNTYHVEMVFNYDILCNQVAGSIDSRLINKNGFVVDLMNDHGISVKNTQRRSELSQSVDSHQADLDLATTIPYYRYD